MLFFPLSFFNSWEYNVLLACLLFLFGLSLSTGWCKKFFLPVLGLATSCFVICFSYGLSGGPGKQ